MLEGFSSMFRYSLLCFLTFICLIYNSHQGNVSQNSPMLLYSTIKDIRLVNSNRGNNKAKPITVVKNYTYIAAIDYHYEKKKIFWADHHLEAIFSVEFDGTTTQNKTEIINGVFMPDGLACDWITNKIYWTDSETNRIEVATIDGQHRKVLFWTDFDQPRAIAVVPMEGYIFWTDWGESPKIERASMDGNLKSRIVVVSENIFWPNGLTIDYKNRSVYWVDGKLKFIKKMDFDGKNEQMILDKGFEYPFALTKFDTKLFWTDWKTGAIHLYDMEENRQKPLELLVTTQPMDIHIWDQRHQPDQTHPCQINNGGCSHLCLISSEPPHITCACPSGIKLIDDKTCADGPQELLLLAKRTDICLIYLDSPDYTYKVLPLADVKYSIAIDYDPVDEFVYWSDDEVKKIQRARLNGSDQQDVVLTEIQNPDGIALDWISRNVYWTDTGTDRIEVSRLTGGYRKVIIMDKLVDPRGIAVAPELGWLFWSDWNEKHPKVERSNLDGSERLQIVNENLGWPNGITLDLENFKIYWCDAKKDKIEYARMDGTERRELISDNVPHVFGLTLMGDYLYWTDWQRRAIDRAHKETGSYREVIVDQLENVMGLKAISLSPVTGWNPCKENNGNCSQLCFYRHNQTRICACQIDYELANDKQTCVKPETFLLYTKRDSIGRISIENDGNEVTIPIAGIKQASAIDFEPNTMRIYWSDSKLRTIMRAYINGSDPQRVIDLGLTSPEGIAVDWLGLNIYWTDPAAHKIEVSRLVGTSRRTLIWDHEPHSIVLDPVAGYMYWSEWGPNNCIKKASMDGRQKSILVTTSQPASSLTIDYEKKRLYWIERGPNNKSAIVSTDLDGNDQRNITLDKILEPVGLTLHKENIYWSDNQTKEIFRASKIDGSRVEKLYGPLDGVTDLLVYQKHKHKQTNQCATSNGGCSHLCLALPAEESEKHVGYTCACPTHYSLKNNECKSPSSFMIYSQRNLAVRLLPDTPYDCPEAVLPIQGLKAVKAIDFDTKSNFLYWIDNKTHSIKKSEASGQREPSGQLYSVVVSGNSEISPFDLAIDVIGRLLFWTCSTKDIINITRLDDTNPFGILEMKEGEQPRLLTIHVTKRLLFYTDVGTTPQLVRMRLDGSHRVVITKDKDIGAIAIDTENDNVVWAQGSRIFTSNIEGENRHDLLKGESSSRIIQLTVYSGWIYWIDKELHQQLQRVEWHNSSRSFVPIQATHILDLISVQHPGNHSCNLPHHKQCSHFCILDGDRQVCACPNGKVLQEDKRTCQIIPDCGSERFTCNVAGGTRKDCIPIAWRCDHQRDCEDGSDEEDCPQCLPDQFRCQDGECINKENYCDTEPHCKDKSDEKNCCHDGFQCPQTEVCLAKNFRCDGNENCADGSDEKDCPPKDPPKHPTIHTIVFSVTGVVIAFALFSVVFLRKKFLPREEVNDQSEDSLSPMHPNSGKNPKLRKGIPDVVRMSMLNDSGCPSTYDRRHVTGASSSSNTNGSSICYPRETLNPPPSPATTRGSSPSSRYRPYRHYRVINQPPPPTPCSTDICDESDYNYPMRGPFPPPPTPRSHCHQESCPPSPSSRSSTYFSPLPPPPSPVASPRGGYDS